MLSFPALGTVRLVAFSTWHSADAKALQSSALLKQAMQALSSSLVSSDGARACFSAYTELPQRDRFFSRAARPPNVPPERFGMMLAKGGIHPRGVVLDSEFVELPIRVNKTLLREELKALLQAGHKWVRPEASNQAQGVVSEHLKLALGEHDDLLGPFNDMHGRLQASPYIRSVLASFGSVIGNVGFMRLPASGQVEYHFDTSSYWLNRVRVHIPVTTNKKTIFSCGQMGEEYPLHMKPGRIYLFDNHLGHKVENNGKSARVHLTVDLIGSRRFWELVRTGKAIGNEAKNTKIETKQFVEPRVDAAVVLERWDDTEIVDCASIATATRNTAATMPGLSESDVVQLEGVVTTWCAYVGATEGGFTRQDEVRLLQMLVAQWDCGREEATRMPDIVSPMDIVDAVSEMYRRAEADAELRPIGATHQPSPKTEL
jgi:hypothetical protein